MHKETIQRIKKIFDDALSDNKDQLLLKATISTQRGVSVFERKPHSMEISDEIRIGLTVGVDGRWTSSSIENPDTLQQAIESTRDAATFTDADLDRTLAVKATPSVQDPALDESITNLSIKDLQEKALAVEAAAWDYSPDISKVPYAGVGFDQTTQIVCNSNGVWLTSTKSIFQSSVSAVAQGKDQRPVNASDSLFVTHLKDYHHQEFANRIAQEALDKRNPRSLPSGRMPVLIHTREAAHMISQFWGVFSGDALHKKLSKLEGKIGQSIANPILDITDSPTSSLSTVPFDAEGSASFSKKIISQGKFKTFLHNLYSAKKTGMKNTSNASAGIGSLVGVAPLNLSWGGTLTPNLIGSSDNIFLVTEMSGASASAISGDFSYGAAGFWIKNGKIDHAIADVTLAGNFFDLLLNIEAIGDDPVTISPSSMGSYGGRTLRIKGLDVSGSV